MALSLPSGLCSGAPLSELLPAHDAQGPGLPVLATFTHGHGGSERGFRTRLPEFKATRSWWELGQVV